MTLAVVEHPPMGADEAVFRLALADWPARKVAAWWAAGVDDPMFARRLDDAGGAREVAVGLFERGFDADTALRLDDAEVTHIDVDGYRSVGLDEIDDMVDAQAAGFIGRHVPMYRSVGVGDVDTMRRLATIGVDGSVAVALHDAGVADAETMLALHIDGLTGEAIEFAEIGVCDLDVVRRLNAAWIYAGDAARHHRPDDGEPLDVAWLLSLADAGLTVVDHDRFMYAGVCSIDAMCAHVAAGVTSARAERYARSGVRSDQILAAHTAGISPQAAGGYVAAKVTDVDDMVMLRREGIDGNDAHDYAQVSIVGADRIVATHRGGLSGLTLVQFAAAGIAEHRTVRRLVDAGVTGPAALGFSVASVTDPDEMAALTAAGVDGVTAGERARRRWGTTATAALADTEISPAARVWFDHLGVDADEMVTRWAAGDVPDAFRAGG